MFRQSGKLTVAEWGFVFSAVKMNFLCSCVVLGGNRNGTFEVKG
jgi:hypothetical protein